jgi:transcriptional regulator with XRE-family HTH domain
VAIHIPLKAWRINRLLTQEELAARSGVSQASIMRIERGQRARIKTVRKLLAALDMSTESLDSLAAQGVSPSEHTGRTPEPEESQSA